MGTVLAFLREIAVVVEAMAVTVLAFLREIAVVVEAMAVVVLVGVTCIYALYTKRILEEMRKQNRPYLYIGVEDFGESGRELWVLVIRNTGNRVAQNIRLKIIQDALIWISYFTDSEGWRDDTEKISALDACKNGIPSLLPGVKTKLGNLYAPASTDRSEEQHLSYVIEYSDGAGTPYSETLSLTYFLPIIVSF